MFCFINGFTGGFGICLGQRCGAKDEKGMRKSIAVSTLLSIAFTVVLTLVCCLLAHQILSWMQIPNPPVNPLIKQNTKKIIMLVEPTAARDSAPSVFPTITESARV